MITDALVAFRTATPPEDARAMMRLSVLDCIACGLAGQAEGTFASFTGAFPGGGPCSILGGGQANPAEAALINGTLCHALDYDDTHFDHIGHTSVAILPAALALGEDLGATLSEIIDAALIGSEAAVAVGLWLGRGHYQVGYHQTATAGSFGATMAAARLLELDSDQTRAALGLASTMASGLKSQFGTMGKPLNAGLAARTGVEAALWASRGMTSSAELEAFGATHHGAGADVQIGAEPWRMTRISRKLHACCHGLHACLNATATADLADATSIEVRTHPRWLSVCNIAAPSTGLECKFSYKQVLAMRAFGIATDDIDVFTDALAARPDLTAFRDRITVTGDDTLTEWQARVLIDGQTCFSDLEDPIPTDQLTALLTKKARTLVGDRAIQLWDAIQSDDRSAFFAALA